MDELLKRLRGPYPDSGAMREAANLLEQQAAEIERLKAWHETTKRVLIENLLAKESEIERLRDYDADAG